MGCEDAVIGFDDTVAAAGLTDAGATACDDTVEARLVEEAEVLSDDDAGARRWAGAAQQSDPKSTNRRKVE